MTSPNAVRCAASVISLIEERFEVLASELTIVDPVRKLAGTADLVLRSKRTGQVLLGDIKTGGSPAETAARFSGLSWSTQLTAYALCSPCDEDFTPVPWESLGMTAPSTTDAVVIHVHRDTAVATLIRVELDVSLVDAALGVRNIRKRTLATTVL